MHADIKLLADAFDVNERGAREVAAGLSERLGTWRARAGSWSVAECLDHLAVGNRVYLQAMEPAAADALARGRMRRGPVRPGLFGGLFVKSLEPPATRLTKLKAPRLIVPRESPPLADALAQFLGSLEDVRTFLQRYAEIDLTGVTFPNPFIRGVRFSLATGVHVLAAHQRRHVWQARNVRAAAQSAAASAAVSASA